MENKLDLIELLEYIDPASLGYQEWVNVGMALKQEGYTAVDWDQWSQSDSRYHSGECFKMGVFSRNLFTNYGCYNYTVGQRKRMDFAIQIRRWWP